METKHRQSGKTNIDPIVIDGDNLGTTPNNPYPTHISLNETDNNLFPLSIDELKRKLNEHGIDFRDCMEKRDLVQRLVDAETKARETRPTKRQRKSTTKTSDPIDGIPESPIKLFATLQDETMRNTASVSGNSSRKKYCQTLREMIGLDGSQSNGERSVSWMILSNFLVDFEYLLDKIPELVSWKTIAFYGLAQTSPEPWRQACTQPDGSCTADFCQLTPSDPPGSPHNPLPYKIDYGVHHSKMFIVGYSDGTVRVIIHTANLCYGDIHLKAQGAYIEDFPLKNPAGCKSSDFEVDLVSYMESYHHTKAHEWADGNSKRTITQQLRLYDFSKASVVLVASTPGRHGLQKKLGHLKVKHTVAKHCEEGMTFGPLVCQFSSMGSLTAKWLSRQLLASFTNRGPTLSNQPPDTLNGKIKLVYPTSQEIRTSVEGYRGGNSVPGTHKNVGKPFLQPLYCRWSSCKDTSSNPVHKGSAVPHIKTFFQLATPHSFNWFMLTSHNMSKAAWGEIQNGRYGPYLFIRHWELGVFLSPKLFAKSRKLNECNLVPLLGGQQYRKGDVTIPVPFNVQPKPYTVIDKPWEVDIVYNIEDAFGCFHA